MEKYNGWKNRATWLVNVHLGDYFQETALEGTEWDRESIQDAVEEFAYESHAPGTEFPSLLVQDMIQTFLAEVDFDEIVEHIEAE